MLRESTGNNTLILEPGDAGLDDQVPLASKLLEFTDAVCSNDPQRIEDTRTRLMEASDDRTLVDAAGIIADFQALTRIADATGTELDERFRL
jgi:hypothetical protein